MKLPIKILPRNFGHSRGLEVLAKGISHFEFYIETANGSGGEGVDSGIRHNAGKNAYKMRA